MEGGWGANDGDLYDDDGNDKNDWLLTMFMKMTIDIYLMTIFLWRAVMSLYGGGQMTGVAVDSGQVGFNFDLI